MSSEEMDATSVEIPSRRRMTSCLVCFEQNQVSNAVLSMHPELHTTGHTPALPLAFTQPVPPCV